MTSLFRTIDPYVTNISGAAGAYQEAYKHGDRLAMLESAVETNNAVTQLFYYLGTATTYMGHIGIQLISITTEFVKKISPFLAAISLAIWLAVLSIVVAAGCLIKETLSLVRQIRFISMLNASNDPLALIQDLKKSDPLTLKRSLPEWLYDQIEGPSAKMSKEEKERDDLLKSLLSKELYNHSQAAKLKEAPELTEETLELIRSYANKKIVLHIIGQVASVLGVIGGIGMLIAFPPAIAFILLGFSIAVAITAYAYKSGVVDNPDGEFSFKRCVPEFILNLPKTITDLGKSLDKQIKEHSKQKEEYRKWVATPAYYETSSVRFKRPWETQVNKKKL